MNLRDQTRVAEQTRTALEAPEFEASTVALKDTQQSLHDRTKALIEKIEEIEITKEKNFAKAKRRLEVAKAAMDDAVDLLAGYITGGQTIAAETEAIEALLITRRGGGGGGGGGDTPGGGTGGGETDLDASALAKLGEGFEFEERTVGQAVGSSRSEIPEEFRSGLDAYFGAVDGQTN